MPSLPLTPTLSQGKRGFVHSGTVASGGHGFDPPLIRCGEPSCPGREAGCRASGAGPWATSGEGEHRSTRFGARTRMCEAGFGRSHGRRRPKAHRRVPLDKRMSRRYPTSVGRISGGEDLWCYLLKRAGLSKVTRPGPKGGRNPIEGCALVSCVAKPRHSISINSANV